MPAVLPLLHYSRENPSHELLSELAQSDPVAFDSLRKRLIQELIDSVPEANQRRLLVYERLIRIDLPEFRGAVAVRMKRLER